MDIGRSEFTEIPAPLPSHFSEYVAPDVTIDDALDGHDAQDDQRPGLPEAVDSITENYDDEPSDRGAEEPTSAMGRAALDQTSENPVEEPPKQSGATPGGPPQDPPTDHGAADNPDEGEPYRELTEAERNELRLRVNSAIAVAPYVHLVGEGDLPVQHAAQAAATSDYFQTKGNDEQVTMEFPPLETNVVDVDDLASFVALVEISYERLVSEWPVNEEGPLDPDLVDELKLGTIANQGTYYNAATALGLEAKFTMAYVYDDVTGDLALGPSVIMAGTASKAEWLSIFRTQPEQSMVDRIMEHPPEFGAKAASAGTAESTATAELEEASVVSPMPVTANDMRWEAWHNGTIEVLGEPGTPNSEVVKVYHDDSPYRPFMLRTPSGATVEVSSEAIVQVYPTDGAGRVADRPSHVFQYLDGHDAPDGYTMEAIPDTGDAILMRDDEHTVLTAEDDYVLEPGDRPSLGRDSPFNPWLERVSNFTARLHQDSRIIAIPSGNPHETVAYYPMAGGQRINVVTPGGRLIKGRTGDVVELLTDTPDLGYEPLRRLRLGELAKEPHYMQL